MRTAYKNLTEREILKLSDERRETLLRAEYPEFFNLDQEYMSIPDKVEREITLHQWEVYTPNWEEKTYYDGGFRRSGPMVRKHGWETRIIETETADAPEVSSFFKCKDQEKIEKVKITYKGTITRTIKVDNEAEKEDYRRRLSQIVKENPELKWFWYLE